MKKLTKDFRLPNRVYETMLGLKESGYEVYLVGGAVRDLFLGKIIDDWDFTTNATPEQILKVFPDGIYENAFGTVMIDNTLTPHNPFDVTTFRTEHGYSDLRRPDKVYWGKTIEEDLKRRDFTVNAIALKLGDIRKPKTNSKSSKDKDVNITLEIIDPYNGRGDLEIKLIKAVGIATERFSEDALRMMRAVRIASELGFAIEETTLEAIKKNSHLLKNIAKERVRDEFLKILGSEYPYEGIMLMRNVNLLYEVLPEMEKTFDVEQKSPGRHHIYDVGTHSMYSLKYVSERNTDPIVRLATMIHDIGKVQTYNKLESGTITFYNHEIVSAKIAKRLSDRLRFSNKQKDRLYKLVRYHQFSVTEKQTDSAVRRFIRKVGKENIADMLDLRVGDRLGGGARETSWRLEEFKKRLIEVQKQPFSVQDLKITGHDVMQSLDLKPGPKVGEILSSIFSEVEDKKIENKKSVLLEKLKEFR